MEQKMDILLFAIPRTLRIETRVEKGKCFKAEVDGGS